MVIRSLALAAALASAVHAGEIVVTVKDAKKGKPVAGAVVFIIDVPGKTFPPPKDPVVMEQIDKDFKPETLTVLLGTKVRFPNRDATHHHLYSFSEARKFELPLYKKEEPDPVVMDKPGLVKLGCNIHDWMRGYILVLSNPYYAVTDRKGRATITGVPAGKYEVSVWSKRVRGKPGGTRAAVTVGSGKTTALLRPKTRRARKARRPKKTVYY